MSACDPFRILALIAILQLGESRPKPVACYPWLAQGSADQRTRLTTEGSFHLRMKLATFTNRSSPRTIAMSKS
jgi:hypothetical protein